MKVFIRLFHLAKICCVLSYILFQSLEMMAQGPYIRGSLPSDGSTELIRNAFVSARIVFPDDILGIDAETLDTNSVKLVKTNQPEARVDAFVMINAKLKNLVLEPKHILEANTSYTFSISSGLKDIEGNAFQPYTVTFVTGETAIKKYITTDNRPEHLVIGPEKPKPAPPMVPLMAVASAPPKQNTVPPPSEAVKVNQESKPVQKDSEEKEIVKEKPIAAKTSDTELSTTAPTETRPAQTGEVPPTKTEAPKEVKTVISFKQKVVNVDGNLPIHFVFAKKTTILYQIKSSSGEVVKRGKGLIEAGEKVKTVSLQSLEAGRYKISVKAGTIVQSHIFVVKN